MAGNRILLATVVLALLLAVTVWQFNSRDQEDVREPEVSAKLPKLKKDDIDEISIAALEKPAVSLKKTDKTWALIAPLKAPADQSAVDAVLSKLEELEVVGVAATKPENYEKLEVTDKKADHVIVKKDGKPLADLLIGAYRTGNTMVREAKGVNVAIVKGSIKYAFEKDVKDWRDKVVVEASPDQIKSIAFHNAKGNFRFEKEGTAWKQAPGDKVLPNFDSGKIVSLSGTAGSLRAQDFAAPEITPDAAGVGDKPDGLVTLSVGGGDAGEQQIVLRAGHKHGEGYYLMREGKDTIYVVSDFGGSRMLTGPEGFVKDEPKAADSTNKAGAKVPPAVADMLKAHAPGMQH